MIVSPDILAKNQNFKKLIHTFVNEIVLKTKTLISSCPWKTLVLFSLRKKRPENAFFNTNSKLSQNRTEESSYVTENNNKFTI